MRLGLSRAARRCTRTHIRHSNLEAPPNHYPPRRQFLISWVAVLESVPDLDLLAYLPELLDGLLNLLSDPNRCDSGGGVGGGGQSGAQRQHAALA